MTQERAPSDVLLESWPSLSTTERREAFNSLPRIEAEELFLNLPAADKVEMLSELSLLERRSWLRLMPPDDAADFIQELPPEQRDEALSLLDYKTQKEVLALMAYAEDAAGGLMSPRFFRLRPDMPVDEAVRYLRAQAQASLETIYYAYVLDSEQHLKGIVSFRDLFLAHPEKKVSEIMETEIVSVPENMDQEEVGRRFSQYDLAAIPVVDESGHMKGIVTADDIVDVVQEEATEDIHKLGGIEALDAPYLKTGLGQMLRKRAIWLIILFFGQFCTASVMGLYESQIEKAVVLALFIPLILSSGGNSGSQASTLIIRAIALGEIRGRDWWRVLLRELSTGVLLGFILGIIGLLVVLLWPAGTEVHGAYYVAIATTIAISVICVVLWGTTIGAMLPFVLRHFKFDPAAASAPLVATLNDVTGLIIYFTVASLLLSQMLG